YARQYVDGQPRAANNNAPRQNQLAVDPASPEQHVEDENRVIGGVALAISRPEDFLPLQTDEEKGALDYLAAHLTGSWENFPGALVISGGGFNPITIGSIERKFDELEKASPVEEIKITEVKESSVPLAFYREEVPGGSPNFQIPLLVRAKMANFDVRRILVDQGSSCDIMYSGLFKVLQLTEENLAPYVGSDLQGFNGSTTKPWGYVDLIVTFGENRAMKSVKVKFLVVDCPSLYNCIIGRPTLAELFAVSSTIHLKLKYYTKDGQVATINGDIEAARRCFEAASKNLNSVVTPKKKKAEAELPGVNSISTEDEVELDARTSKKERKQEKKTGKDDLLIKENYRLIPDGEFELVPLGEDPTKGVKIGAAAGIEANPDKCRAFFDYPTPKSKKSIQTLNGMLTSMARFVAKSAQHALPLFKLLRKETTFEWTEECEGALQHLKRALSEPPVLTRPVEGEKLYLYLAVASEAISAVLIRETEQGQKHVYFVSRALQGPELRYLQIEKIALAVIMAVRKLRYYFLAHSIIIRTDQPVKQLLARPNMVGRMLKWSLELAEFDISFDSRKALKAHVLADFVAEMTTSTTSEKNKWTIFVDGSSNSQESGAGIILENGDGVLIEVSLGLSFSTTNNQAEYEAFLVGLRLAEDMGAEEIRIFTDSQLVASQVSGEYQTKEERLLEYLNLIRAKLAKFKETEVKHVPREHNARADVLSKLASTRCKKAGNQSLIQETLTKPSIEKTTETPKKQRKSGREHAHTSCSYVMLDDKLYRRGFSIPLLKCVEEACVEFILQEIHEGINGQHIGGRSLARKALRAGYYWPTMQNDARDHVLKCDKCQKNGDMHLAPANELKTLISPWPFAWWEMDILGPFPTAARQVKYLIVVVDYFTKWIEAEPLAKISASNILRFFKRDVLARFGIPQVVVTDNGTQFTNKKFQEFLAAIGTTQHFTSVEHPQTNGQA
ncbi:hypothetical protein TSUD_417990, partial [Trifolium subterraneum]